MRFLIFAPQTRQCMLISRLMSHRSQDVTQIATTIWYPKEPFTIMVISIGWMNQTFAWELVVYHQTTIHLKPTAWRNRVHSDQIIATTRRQACLPHERLFQGETDGSSFPNGGLRVTHSAAAFTTWDRAAPPFVASVFG